MRKTFANTLRKDLKVVRRGRFTEVSGGGLKYRLDRANAQTAEFVNSKIPAATLRPPMP
ncbi:MAG: hypothetical protein KGJ37_04610 [Verrucomicrobiota bacterium]|nr:hypothetical protein [Verrucomicrobiota bacterium]